MKKIIISFLLFDVLSFAKLTNAQNLFSNPDFENYSACPTSQGQVPNCTDWFELVQSADYMNCAYTCWTTQQTIGAQSGLGYMGFATYGSSNASEALGQYLTSPLVGGVDYTITFWAKKTSSGFYSSNCSGVSFWAYNGNPVSGTAPAGVCMGSLGFGATLLVTSPMVSNLDWQQYTVSFTSPGSFDFVGMCVECLNCPQYIFVDNFSFIIDGSNFTFNNACFGDSTNFQSTIVAAYDSLDWNFGDPASGVQNFSELLNPAHLFSTSGNFNVQLIIYNTSGVNDTITNNVIVNAVPVVFLGNDTLLCNGQSLVLNAGNAGATYLWSTGVNTQTINVSATGSYSVTVTNGNCEAVDSISISSSTTAFINIGNDTTYCSNFSRILDGGNNATSYLWSDGTTNQTITINQAGNYWAQITNNCGTGSDTIHIFQAAAPQVDLGNDTSFCGNFSISYDVSCVSCNYLWSNNSITPVQIFNGQELIMVQVSNICGIAKDTLIIIADPIPYIVLPSDTEICSPFNHRVMAESNMPTIFWSTGDSSLSIHITKTGIYWADVSNSCGSDVDTIKIFECPGEYIIPNAFSPNGDGRNDFLFPIRIGDASLLQFDIYNRWGQRVFTYSEGNNEWDGTYNEVACAVGVYVYVVRYKDNITGTILMLNGNATLLK